MILPSAATLTALVWIAPAATTPAAVVPAVPPVWDAVAGCESDRIWDADTGNGYYGGLQFSRRSWEWVGGTGNPADAAPHVQVEMARRLLDRQGWQAWPTCSVQLGLR